MEKEYLKYKPSGSLLFPYHEGYIGSFPVEYRKHNKGVGHFEVKGFQGVFHACYPEAFAGGLKKLMSKYDLNVDESQVIEAIKEYRDGNRDRIQHEIDFIVNEAARQVKVLEKEIQEIENEAWVKISKKEALLKDMTS
jgi:hypothetical protein